MDWQAWTLTYRARAPVLLGDHPFGFIQRTRLYAPGWTLWGAVTARLTRAFLPRAAGADYEAVGDFVAENLPTSYAFLVVDGQTAHPRYKDGRLCYGSLSAADFEARFLASLGQTAVAPATLTAHTGALHETEVLTARDPVTKEPVRWRFTLYVRRPWQSLPPALAGLTPDDVLSALAELSLGADRGYGLGRLERETAAGPRPVAGESRPHPLAWDTQERTLHAHVPLAALPGDAVRGRAAPIPWRRWQNAPGGPWGPGQKATVQIFYTPGSIVEKEGWQPVIGPYGIWETADAQADPS